ncbi:FAD-dependent oxidoreductase [Nonomuraea sp. NPDC059007]|uniref:FAD-dependent oxidoreductase n=1 Tax=Nonomuraea sp. NPDC059007 TaxID=3346692 RepID=UPI00368BF132
MKALICGAGIAGLTLAWQLERAGWQVEVVEKAPAFRSGGYMIDFYGPGYDVAEQMGLAPRLHELRQPIDGLTYVDRDGRRTSGIDLPQGFREVVSLLRGDLAGAIRDEVRSPVRYGTSVAALSPHDGEVEVELTDGEHRMVDLLVGADGAHSRVRELAFGPQQRFLRYLEHHAAACVLTDSALCGRVGRRYRMLTSPGRMVGAYALDDERVALLFLHRAAGSALPADPHQFLTDVYGDLGWIVPRALWLLPGTRELYYDQVTQVEMDRWSSDRVVLLGDSCQAVSLFAGHGASMAMAAAWTLADELRSGKVEQALPRYEARMRPRITDVQRFGRSFVKWMAPASSARILARDWLLRAASLPGLDRLLMNALSPGSQTLTARSPR